MAAIQRRLDVHEDFIRAWEDKLKKWEIMIAEQEQLELSSDSEDREGEVPRQAIDKSAMKKKSDKQVSGDEDSQQSSSQSDSSQSNSNTGSESDADEDEGTVKGVPHGKEVDRPESSKAADANEERVQKQEQKSSKDVIDKELDTGEQGRSLENTTKEVGKPASASTQIEQPVINTSKVAEKPPTKEVRTKMSSS